MTVIVDIRNAIYEAIKLNKDRLLITDFDLIATYYPKTELQTLAKPRVYVIAMQWSEDKLTRSSVRQLDLPVQVAVQDKVNPTDTDAIDQLVCFVEQLHRLCAKVECVGYVWSSTVGMQDPNGTPYGFLELHENHMFQATFTAHYLCGV